jgi:hypothetical protein
MRQTALLFVIAVLGYAANAQFTLRPQIGIENPTTKISYNDLPSFAPISQFQPQFGVHADYKFKGGFGPFIGMSTSRSLVNYSFTDPEKGMTDYQAELGDLLLALQAGLQYSTKPIPLTKNKPTATTKTKSSECTQNKTAEKSSCYEKMMRCYSSSHCSGNKSKTESKSTTKKDVWTLSLQPSAGISYTPSNADAIETETVNGVTNYLYTAGNLKTAFISGIAFEFAKNKKKFATLSFNYFTSLGSDKTTFESQAGSKTVTTTVSSKVSGWNAALGIPITFAKSQASKSKSKHHDCIYRSEYKSRCGSSYRKI